MIVLALLAVAVFGVGMFLCGWLVAQEDTDTDVVDELAELWLFVSGRRATPGDSTVSAPPGGDPVAGDHTPPPGRPS